ncbi:hypothetical protein IAR55_001192 [Kwoniella newhampshirensis]|uniref:DNA polymerase alpha subunit B n=1 Tax=Kwoniella newhampshirensis TaxID=1651941 RepID=A0AAW0Z4U9_9TREE
MTLTEDTARRELGDHFHAAVTDHPDVMTESFLMSRPSGLRAKLSTLTLDTVREVKKEISREQQAKAVANTANTPDQPQKSAMRKGKGNMADIGGFLASQPFHLRAQPHSLVETLNPHLPPSRPLTQGSKQRISLSSTADPKYWNYRYMFEKISQRSESLDDLIDDYAENIKDAYGISELGDPHFVSEESIYTVGRILSPPTDSSKATASSLHLESSRLLGAGKHIALRFASPKVRGGPIGVKGFGLFPGCLVCFKGRNGGGGAFVVEEVLMTPVDELQSFQHGDKLLGQPISIMTAAGPFTLDDDLAYAPLEALLQTVRDERPDVLLLRVKVLPNPCTFSINEILISLSSVDVLFHLRREELFQKAEEVDPDPDQPSEVKDAMAGLVRHVLGQRNFYPIFPPPEIHTADINLDVTHYPLLKMDGPAPDILILPSKLRHFSKIVDSTLVVNPAHLARAHSAGTYAKIIVHSTPRSELVDEFSEHKVWNRARSEIWRI